MATTMLTRRLKAIALIAHDRKKDDMVNFAKQHSPVLSRYKLIATGTTGQRIQQGTGLPVERLLSGPMGGDAQIAALVATGQVAAVIFLIDPLTAQPHEPDIQALVRICGVHNVALATNLATAEVIVANLARATVAYLIFNPISGRGNSWQRDLEQIQLLLEPHMQLQILLTSPDINPEEQAKEAMSAGADIIIASGGDGTVSAVAGPLIGTGIPLGIIPRGTANAFAAAANIPPSLNPIKTACDIILAGKTRTLDVALCNEMPMILLAGIGYEAETVERADREAKNRWGALAYIMAGWQQLEEQQLFETEIELEGAVKNFQAGAITIANAAPVTSILAQGIGQVLPNDGLLDVTIATAHTKMEALKTVLNLLGAVLIRSETDPGHIVHLRTRKVKVRVNPPQKVAIDGEIIGSVDSLEVECIPCGLTLLAPPGGEACPPALPPEVQN